MSSVPLNVARVSLQMSGSLLLNNLQTNQVGLLQVQQQLSSGQRLNLPSDDPAAALGIVSLKRQIADNTTYTNNLGFASSFLQQADSSLGSLSNLINQAQSIASSQVGADSTADQRAAQAQVVDSLLNQALDISNQQYLGQSIFGGQNGTVPAFVSAGGGYKYQGTNNEQSIQSPTGGSIPYTLTGQTAFGAVSSQVVGYQNLTPALTANTRLSDLNGAKLNGVATGPVQVTLGATSTTIDLSSAATVNDVVTLLNAGLAGAGSNATVSISGGSLVVNGDSTQSLAISDAQGGTTASDLGIAGTVASGGTLTGAALGPRITATTPISALDNGAGIDPSGIIITNGANTATISLNGLNTVEDFINAVNNSGTNVRAEINDAGTGINLLNPLSGASLTVGENGGNTAQQLGIRSLNPQTDLSDFNNGLGVTPISGTLPGPTGQITVTTTSGSQFNVQMNGITTPTQLINAINTASGNSTVTAALNGTGNGITLTDSSGGSGNVSVAAGANFNADGSTLGIIGTGTGATLAGGDITFSTDDFRITRRDGTSFTVSLGGSPPASTVQDVLNRINNADGNTAAATHVTASMNPTGNGIQLSDASSGSGALTVTAVNASEAASQLGIYKTAPSTTPGVITGDDNNPLQPQGTFSSLTMLRDALLRNDTQGIAQAASLLQKDASRATDAHGLVGAREQDVASRQTSATDEQTQLQQALSVLNDTDFAQAATRLQQLQTAFQASLQVAQTTGNLSLLDFLQ
jgi:flagellar hook-associated protein 3 FlgL